MSYEIKRESHVHGKSWEKQGLGYFSDSLIAKDYVAAIMRVASSFKPSAIADLGGGTGFILEELIKAGIDEKIRLIIIDESEPQLCVCKHPRITPMNGSFQSFKRSDIINETETLMLISRSVLQYAGFLGQKPWLAHVRSQMKPGEWFVHQPGCTEDGQASKALNRLFEQMGVDKWVPHKEALVHLLVEAGFDIADDFPMPAVGMVSEELVYRYGFPSEDLAPIEAELRRTCSDRPDMLTITPTGFIFNFPYRVFLCKAVD
jgi:hypothetical protein